MSPKNQILRWGLLSTARINRALFEPLHISPRSELAAVASRDLKKASEYAHAHAIPCAYGSYEELLADPHIDVIYNPLPNHMHAEWTIRALEAGKHVLLEKPFALTLAEVQAVAQAAQRAGKVVAEAFMYRNNPQTLKVQELVQDGALGELLVMQGFFTNKLTNLDDFRWRPEYGGGAIWDVGCYPISYMRMLAGAAPLSVFGSRVNASSGVDLTFLGQMTYPGGLMGQFYCSFGLPYFTRMEIRGSQGTLTIPMPFSPRKDSPPAILRRGDVEEQLPLPQVDLYLGEVEDMECAILDGAAPHLSLQESQENIATILALLASARVAKPVAL